MGFELEKRLASELNRLVDDPALDRDRSARATEQHIERMKRIAAELKERLLGEDKSEAEAPGKRTAVDESVAAAIQKLEAKARSARAFEVLPWRERASFDDFRSRGLREVVAAVGNRKLRDATIAAAEPSVASRAGMAQGKPQKSVAGQAMWRAAERRAATLYRHAQEAGEVASDDPIVDEALERCGSGQALPAHVRKQMEADLGISLARVRVHTDPVAAAAAKAVRAEAFTVGEDIFFAEHAYAPDTKAGQKLLAHELTHVVQAYQGRTATGGKGVSVSQPGESLEREADAVAERIERKTERRGKGAAAAPRTAGPPRARGSQPSIAPAPTLHAPVAPSKGGGMLLRRATQTSAQANSAPPASRERQDREKKGTKPTLKLERDKHNERAAAEAKKGSGGIDHASEGKALHDRLQNATKAPIHQLKDTAKKVTAEPPGKHAKHADKHHKKAHKDHQKAAKDAHKHAKAAAKKAKAKKHKPEHGPQLKKGDDGTGAGPIHFKAIKDWSQYMPEALPDQDEREKKRILALVKKQVNGDRKQSAQMLNQLRKAQMQQAAQVRAMLPGLQGQIRAGQAAALGQVSASESAQCASVQSHTAGVQAQVRSAAAASIGQINSAHAAAVAAINQAKQQANQQLTQSKTQALSGIDQAETAQLAVVAAAFARTQAQIIAVGAAKSAEASGLGDSISLPYDGDKLEAARKAAQDVAAEYAKAMPEEASKAAQQILAEQPKTEADVRKIAADMRTKVNEAFTQCKQTLDQVCEQAITGAGQIQSSSVAQVNSTSATTISSLASAAAQAIAGIHQQAAGARAGIQQAGAAALSSVAQGVAQAASGIEKGAHGLIKGAKQVEAPNPEETKKQCEEGIQGLAQGTKQIGAGLQKSASGAVAGMHGQAQGAASGMAQAAGAANAAATQMGQGAIQGMRQMAQGASQSLTQLAQNTTQNANKIAQEGGKSMQDVVKATTEAYQQATTQLNSGLDGAVNNVRTSFNEAVPTKETADILANAKKAADAVKPWWQKALAFVVSIVVAIVVVVVVTALIVTTGPVGAILVGAAAGALGSVLGQMASNLVLGNGLMDGITWQTVAMGAIGGAVGAGFSQGVTAGARALAAGSTRFAGAGARVVTAMSAPGGGSLGGFAIKTGVGIAGDTISDAAGQLIVTGKYEFSMENLATSIVTNAVSSTKRYEGAQERVQGGIQNRVGHIEIGGVNGRISAHGPGSPVPSTNGGGGGGGGGGDHGGGSQVGASGPHPTGNSGGGANTQHGNTGGGTNNTGGGTQHANTGGGGTQHGTSNTTQHGNNTGGAHPDGGQSNAGGSSTSTQHGNNNGGGNQNAHGNNNAHGDGNNAGGTQNAHGNNAHGDGNNAHGDRNNTNGDRNNTNGDRTNTNDGQQAHGDRDGAHGDRDGAHGDRDGQQARGDRDNAQGDRDNAHGDRDGAHGDRDGAHDNNNAHGDNNNAHGDGNQSAHGDNGGDNNNAHADSDGPESASAGELADLGYANATRANADRAATSVEGGNRPSPDTVRDTEANQRGLRDLDQVNSDPRVSAEGRQNIRRDVADQLRGEEPTGNLHRDVAEARAREEARARAEQQAHGNDNTHAQDGQNTHAQGDGQNAHPQGDGQNAHPTGDGQNAHGNGQDGQQTHGQQNDGQQPHDTQTAADNAPAQNGNRQHQPLHEGGLADPAVHDAMVDSMHALQGEWRNLPPAEREQRLTQTINEQMRRAGLPEIEIKVVDLGGRNGELRFHEWAIAIDRSLVHGNDMTHGRMQGLTDTILHEARHGEQWYMIARHMGGQGLDAPTIAARTHIPEPVVRRALADSRPMTPEQAQAARTYYDSIYGANAQHRNDVLTRLEQTPRAYDAARAHAQAVENNPHSTPAERAEAAQRLQEAWQAQMDAYNQYRALPEERDAWAVGNEAGDRYSARAQREFQGLMDGLTGHGNNSSHGQNNGNGNSNGGTSTPPRHGDPSNAPHGDRNGNTNGPHGDRNPGTAHGNHNGNGAHGDRGGNPAHGDRPASPAHADLPDGASVLRQDNNFPSETNHKGQRKPHLDADGNLVPANPHGDATILQHVIGRSPAKDNSPYSSFMTVESGVAKAFGREEIRLDVDRLQADIDAGRLPGVEIVSPRAVQDAIAAEIHRVAPGLNIDEAMAGGSPKAYREYVDSLNLSKRKTSELMDRLMAMHNTRRDGEWLIKGTVPARYFSGPHPTPASMAGGSHTSAPPTHGGGSHGTTPHPGTPGGGSAPAHVDPPSGGAPHSSSHDTTNTGGDRTNAGNGPDGETRGPARAEDPAAAGGKGQRNQPLHEGGLADPQLRRNFTDRMQQVQRNWKSMSPHEREAALRNGLNEQMRAAGMPELKLVVDDLGGRHGELRFEDFAVAVDRSLIDNGNLTREQMMQLADTLLHEARHGEQWYMIARHMGSMGLDAPTIATRMNMPEATVRAALADTRPMTPEQAAAARTYYDSVYGANAGHRNRVLTDLERLGNALDQARADLEQVEKNPSSSQADRDAAAQRLRQAYDDFDKVYAEYRDLPEERDAWAVGNDASDSYGYHTQNPLRRLWDRLTGNAPGTHGLRPQHPGSGATHPPTGGGAHQQGPSNGHHGPTSAPRRPHSMDPRDRANEHDPANAPRNLREGLPRRADGGPLLVTRTDPQDRWIVYQNEAGEQRIRFRAAQARTLQDANPGRNMTTDNLAGINSNGDPFVYEGRHRAAGVANNNDTIPPDLGGVPGQPGVLDYEFYEGTTSEVGIPMSEVTIDYDTPDVSAAEAEALWRKRHGW